MNEITIVVRIESIVYRNDENGYCICEVHNRDEGVFTAVGYLPSVAEGEKISMHGCWVTHEVYGEQFKVNYYENVMPTEEEDIITYLSSGIIPGVRRATAEKLVGLFGCDTLDIMMNEPMRMTEIKGITQRRAERINRGLKEVQSMQSIVVFLQKYNISANLAVKIYNAFGGGAVGLIEANPYILADEIMGISFRRADAIASMMGIAKNSVQRISSGIRYILQNGAYSSGHTYIPKNMLVPACAKYLGVTVSETENGLSALLCDKKVRLESENGEERVYLSSLYNAESYTAMRLASLSMAEQKFSMTEERAEEEIAGFEEDNKINLAPEQKEAVKQSLISGVMVLTGGPGTGKTTTINTVISILEKAGLEIALAAPTGRAAKRMSEVTGREAKTIHRMLGAKMSDDGNNKFEYDDKNPLEEDAVIIDEVSMIDISLMQSLLKALKPGAKLILSGDADQLPSVGPGNVLRDIVSSEYINTVRLNHIFRQAEESLIVVNAHKINNGEMPELGETKRDFFFLKRDTPEDILATICSLYQTRLPKSYGIDPLADIQVLSPTKKGLLGTINLNRILQQTINPEDILKSEHVFGDTVFRVGDKVMQTKNNYDIVYDKPSGEVGCGIFNGDMGIIQEIDTSEKIIKILFDDERMVDYDFKNLDELDLAYAVTVHKSQGSEFPFLIMPAAEFPPMLMYRNLFYTAVTRAKDMVILLGNANSIYKMTKESEKNTRYSGLKEKLEHQASQMTTDELFKG